MSLAVGCGGKGNDSPAECTDYLCPCSESGIRGAIVGGLGTYTFDCDGPTTVTIRREIVIDRDVTLDGGGNLTIDADRRARVLHVLDGVTAELIALSLINGRQVDGNGGGIRNEGTLTLTRIQVSMSSAGSENGCRTDDLQSLCSEGGGIWNAGALTLIDSTVSDNSAHFGGGIANRGGSLMLMNSHISLNSAEGCRVGAVVCSGGGGVWNSGAFTIQDSTVSGNMSDWGGGIYNRSAFALTRSAVSTNSAGFDGGGLLNFETLIVIDSTVADNISGQSGGGVANEAGRLEVTRSTLSGNDAASAGGGIFNAAGASADLMNMTVSGNHAATGGGMYTSGDLLLASSTIADNEAPTASALYDPGTPDTSPRSIRASLIKGDCAGSPFDSEGYNIESPGDTCGLTQNTDPPAEAQLGLGPLADHGGPTQTHALLESSVAIDQVPEADCIDREGKPLTEDQRGQPRPGGTSSRCDVGAYEAQP
ncbi:MAG: choice-of-anchor Q domain-containing protein [Myxococcales bacterium]